MTTQITPRGRGWIKWHSVGRIAWRVIFEPHDLWVGVYWRPQDYGDGKGFELFVCPFPTLVLNLNYVPSPRLRKAYFVEPPVETPPMPAPTPQTYPYMKADLNFSQQPKEGE